MCGITGIFRYHVQGELVDKDELLRMRESMVNRGPDGYGLWIDSKRHIGLAHRRLAIIDISKNAEQPMMDKNNDIVVCYNGEIYNYLELRSSLKSKGYIFQTDSDTEVLIHLYIEYGMEMVHHLRGMYAFSIWDSNKRGLFIARDPFGIKPIYYADDGNTYRFASQVKALLNGGNIDTSLEPAGHVGFHLLGYIPEPYTLYKGIKAFPAGTTLWIDSTGRKSKRTFFSIYNEYNNASYESEKYSRNELRERLREVLVDSVKCHLIADVPVGIFLSSGLDSATLVALASEFNSNIRTLTLGFEEYRNTRIDETPLAKKIAKHYNTSHQSKWVMKDDFEQERDNYFASMDQPSIDAINTFFVSKVAADAGMKVALSGIGGDEIFGGYPSFSDVPNMVNRLGFMNNFPLVGKVFRVVSAPILKHFTSPKYAGLLEYGGSYGGAYFLRRGLYMPWELPDVLDGEIVKEGWCKLNIFNQLEHSVNEGGLTHCNVSALELNWYMKNQLLRDADWAGMANSLEIRTPLVDVQLFRKLVPLVSSNIRPTKNDMASSPNMAIPFEVLNRPKTGFAVPVRNWLEKNDASQPRGLRGWANHVYNEFV